MLEIDASSFVESEVFEQRKQILKGETGVNLLFEELLKLQSSEVIMFGKMVLGVVQGGQIYMVGRISNNNIVKL